MTDTELNTLLRSNKVKEVSPEYWAQFSGRVTREIGNRNRNLNYRRASDREKRGILFGALGVLFTKPALTVGIAMLVGVFAFLMTHRLGRPNPSRMQFAEAAKYFREIHDLFPNQLRGMIFDSSGPRMLLAEAPSLALSEPLYLKLCNAQGCKRYITFSGQKIRFNNQEFEVLSSRRGEVLLVGEHSVWSSASPPRDGPPFKIEARPLQNAS